MYSHHHNNTLLHHNSKSNLLLVPYSSSENLTSFMDSSPPHPHPLSLIPNSRGGGPLSPQFKLHLNPISYLSSLFRLLIPRCDTFPAIIPSSSPRALPSSQLQGSRRRSTKLTGTFLGQKKGGRVSFAVQETSRSEPALLLDLPIPTSHLVREMASGTVRILLECDRVGSGPTKSSTPLIHETTWSMYCNGRRLGYAASRPCNAGDLRVLGTVRDVSVGAGVVPRQLEIAAGPTSTSTEGKGGGGGEEVMYMRAKFERVIGSRDSEAFYMINPDCGAGGRGPELSIFLLRG